jgi:hypothetical protein
MELGRRHLKALPELIDEIDVAVIESRAVIRLPLDNHRRRKVWHTGSDLYDDV